MKRTYTKTHTNPKAASSHAAKIRARGGKVTRTVKGGKITLKYSFE
jgi:hypothetical protein